MDFLFWEGPLVRGVSQLLSLSPKAPACLRRLASHRRACQRRTLLLGPRHGSCRHQIGSYGYVLVTLNIKIDTRVAVLSTCMPSSCWPDGGILSGRIAAPNHQFTSSRERFLVDSLVGSPDPEYSYNGCTRSLHGCTRLQMKFRAIVGPSSYLLSTISSSSSTCTVLVLALLLLGDLRNVTGNKGLLLLLCIEPLLVPIPH
jgi:hypothetical protein